MKIVRLFVTTLEISCYIWITTVADTDYREDTFINGTGVLNCTTQRQKIHIESVDYNASICSGTNGSIMQHFTNLCNGKSFCEFVVRDTINDLNLTCLANETAANLFDIDYYCTQDGMWSAWSEYSSCSLTCVGGVQSRSRSCNDPAPNKYGQNCTGSNVEQIACNNINCSNPIVKKYIEGEHAQLTCSVEYKEIIDIISINYIHGTCSHNETYGIRNICSGNTNCSFDVSNSNIGSSCGANGRATLEVKYNCIRNGGWSDWNTSDSCPVTCGGAFRNVTRTCSNPYPNEIGDSCKGDDFDERTCNTNNCIDQNTACWKSTVNWNCPDGSIIVDKAVWETSRKCGVGYNSFKSYSVIDKMKTGCENRQNCTFIANDHNFGESCSISTSRCTIFNYVYTCIKATWDDWSPWSKCSRSCGSGIQTRERQCLNQMNTTDGYVSECEGMRTGSRSCNIECPYCNDNHFLYTSIKSSTDLKEDTSAGSGYLLMNEIYTINCCGRIKMWEFVPVNTGRLTFVIMRKTTDNKYKFVGSNQIDITATNLRKSTQFSISEDKRIAITNGDIIGWLDSGSNIVGFHDCLPYNDMCPLSYRLSNAIGEGDVIDITSLSGTSGRSYTVNYSTVENRPIAFALPSKPMQIPDHLNMDALVMAISISDQDYGDYIQDFKLDYDNEYFYFDTTMRNVYVKKKLPHTVGHLSYSLNMTLTVQDSCYNEVTSNVTFVVYNAPPVISGLQNNLEVDPATAVSEPYITQFQVKDPSGDNISCMINETNAAATELFYLQLNDIDVYLKLVNNESIQSNTSSQFILTITCKDGTENTEFELRIKFQTKNKGTPTIPSTDSNAIPIIIGVCVFIFCLTILVIFACIWKRRRKLVNETSENKLNHATCSIAAGVTENPYHDMGQTAEQHNTNDYVEMSGKPPAKEKAFHLGTTEVGAYTEAWR